MLATEKLSIRDYIEQEFPGNSSKPTPQAVRNWIAKGLLDGRKYGTRWYVIVNPTTGNKEIDQILRELS